MITGLLQGRTYIFLKQEKCVSALRMGSQIRKHRKKSVLQSGCVYSVGYRVTQLIQSRLVEVSHVCEFKSRGIVLICMHVLYEYHQLSKGYAMQTIHILVLECGWSDFVV